MLYDKISVPKFTPEQIEECRGDDSKNIPRCNHRSDSGRWCCYFGVWIWEKGKGIRLLRSDRFQRSYAMAVELCKGQEIVDEKTFINRRKACAICPPEDKSECMKLINLKRKNGCADCGRWYKLAAKEVECPKGNYGW